MKVLFVVSDLYFSEPLGAMILSGVCRKAGHMTRLAVIRDGDIGQKLEIFQPDVVAYSVMSPDESRFHKTDLIVRKWATVNRPALKRIMGGPHPTFFPQVLHKMELDAICAGDGERAILRILEAIAEGRPMDGIPNVSTREHPGFKKEIVEDMDSVAFADRDLLYDAAPELKKQGIRSFLTQKGCPYKCTYCFNHAYNKMFKGEGRKLLRRRSVDNVISEIREVVERYPTCRFIRFADDVFVIKQDEWLEEFADKYPKQVGIPFYCLIRANSLDEEVASLLAKAGCRSVGMSVEAGSAAIRNEVLKRNMPDEMLIDAFGLAAKHGINTYGNTILGIPGTRFEDDYHSFMFARRLKLAAPTFSVFSPFPNTDLTRYAQELGVLDMEYDFNSMSSLDYSILKGYTQQEREMQARLAYLGPIFCKLPSFCLPLLRPMLKLPMTWLYRLAGSLFTTYLMSKRVFPGAHPRDPVSILKAVWRALQYFMRPLDKADGGNPSNMRSPGKGAASPEY